MWCNLVWCGVDGLDLVCNYWYDSVQMQSHFPAVALVKYPQSWYLSSTSSVHFFMTEQISKIFHPVSFGRQRSPPGWVKVYVTIQSLLSPISKVAAFAGLHLACAPERESVSFFSCIRCHFVAPNYVLWHWSASKHQASIQTLHRITVPLSHYFSWVWQIVKNQKKIPIIIWWWDEQACLSISLHRRSLFTVQSICWSIHTCRVGDVCKQMGIKHTCQRGGTWYCASNIAHTTKCILL